MTRIYGTYVLMIQTTLLVGFLKKYDLEMTGLDNFCLCWDFAVKLKAELSNNLSLDKNYKLFGK